MPMLHAVLALVLALPALAQTASGTVFGFDGEPCRGAVVMRGAGNGPPEVLTDESGAFAIAGDQPIAQLVVQLEGVQARVPVPGSAQHLVVRFQDQKFTTLRGTVRDPAGELAQHVDLTCKGRDGQTLCAVTTGRDGTFVVRTQTPVGAIVVDPGGLRLNVDGPFAAERPATLDLREHAGGLVRLQGHCFDDADRPAAGWVAQARSAGTRLARTTVADDGSFTLWCRGPVDTIEIGDGVPRTGQINAWDKSARVLLREREHGVVLVSGRVVGANGKAIVGAAVIPTMTSGAPPKTVPPLATTDGEGRFVGRTYRGLPFLFVYHDISNRTGAVAVPTDGTPVVVTIR